MSLRLSLTVLAPALLLAACDSGAEGEVQQQEQLGAAKQELTGEIDRSFAGESIPAVTVADPAGQTLDLGALKGQPVLLNLWATWCAPCVVEMPMLDELAAIKRGELRVITVSQDITGAKAVEPFFDARRFAHLEPWLDPDNNLGASYDGGGVMPLTVLYDASGKEVLRVAGGYHWDSEDALAAIEEALK